MSGVGEKASGTTKTPADFLKSIRGILTCLDGYMNIAMEQTEEYVNGQLKNTYGDAFVRGNNVLYISTTKGTLLDTCRYKVPYPTQGHITPFRQFCKRLHFKGLKTTLALTTFVFNSINPDLSGPISIATISDGYDHGGFETADSIDDYLKDFKTSGSKTIADIIQKHQTSDNPITCIVYDAFLPWALDVAREFGLVATPFFTQPCAVNYVYYLSYINNGSLQLPIEELPFLELQDLPSFFSVSGSYPAYFEMVLQQFINFEKADFVLVNSFQELELHENELWSKACPVLTIGPTIPSIYLDQP
ncbi:unnamed protein product [Arabidopsis thaliana]|uniref:(thale cress) hypothetical protein n=1 Tax=Arabidopsis thaliana TaxID=3702 RepID=A0A7G2EK80_ARATH|nr:unnamed protein product [Arabidopsis thaliana]